MDCNQRATINSQIEIVKALGDHDELQFLSKELKESLKDRNTP